jgi:hypothetical protein
MSLRWTDTFLVGVVLAAAAACSSGDTQSAKLGDLVYDAPSDWHSESPQRSTSLWVPEDNVAKQSVEIIRAEIEPALAKTGGSGIEPLLVQAQGELRQAHVGTASQFTTKRGLLGVRLDADFVPDGATRKYHRVHAVVIDGTTLIHVLYTAVMPDPDLKAFEMVLQTIHRGEA